MPEVQLAIDFHSRATPAFDNFVSAAGELLDHFGKRWLVTNYHDAVRRQRLASRRRNRSTLKPWAQGGIGL